MRVAIAVPNLTPHDAVSNDAVGMYEVLQAEGFECALFTIGGESAVRYTAQAYRDMGWWLGENDIVIYHYCTADATAVRDLTELKARLFIKYHNITPSGFFLGWSADYVRSTRLGRDMLHQIADLPVELFLSDSSFNMSELLDMGVNKRKRS